MATAFSISLIVCAIAVPPASDSIPTELIAVAKASISGVVSPAILPLAANRVAIETTSDSVVA